MLNVTFIAKFLFMNFYYQIELFVIQVASACDKPGKKLLDIGAGSSPYKKYFKQLKYISHDIIQNRQGSIDYVADINHGIPAIKDNSFDFVLCTQVLEHVKSPEFVMKEIHRILKPHGKLFLTTNFIYQIHSSPNDFYRFTEYGLRYLGEVSEFSVEKIDSQGGLFHILSYLVSTLPLRLWINEQSILYWIYIVLFSPLIVLLNLSAYFLDFLDNKRELTINYSVIYEKIV